ncbi:MATE family efflux transporter [Halococcus saccharolyticus]|uniref:Multidrug-efflux transporter n=1 Tax=Halococcus saccharolyticus DSM 5350 TaxID=1227455 RepID=M0MCB9_9EURY|nr:MATE family efflux transporter [Halococcus saccharolyticus]EMA43396.1 multidrug efflux protein norM-like protein [Halococcus saccharolyticus DSM 5350]
MRADLIESERARRTTDLAWPRILTGIARMSKNAVDIAMVGVAVGSVGIAGVGFASPFWGLAFAAGGGIAAGTIALVSQRYGAKRLGAIDQAVRSSAAVVVALTLPLIAIFWVFGGDLVALLSNDAEAVALGATYLRIVAFGIPFAALNLIGSRVFLGVDDARTPMMLRSGGAVANAVLNAALIFGLDLGVAGAALGTVLSNAIVTGIFAVGLVAGRLPVIGELPVQIDPRGSYLADVRELVDIGIPVIGRNLVWTVAEFPMLAIVALFGPQVVAAYVIARRIWGLMNTPGWGFGLASSSLVGQALGSGHEETAEAYGREIVRFAVAVYIVSAAIVFVLAEPIVATFAGGGSETVISVAVSLVTAACVAIVLQGVSGAAAGPLDASGDTGWPFYSQALGIFGVAIPFAYLGATTSLGLYGLYLAFLAETTVPAVLNYYRFATDKWKQVSRRHRPDAPA